jgi:4-hydroxybenzoate polyprenyltransferase
MLVGLLRACHPGPTAVVVLITTALAWRIGWSGWDLALLAGAVLLGQLSIGWANDAHDAADDLAAGRAAKPTVAGLVRPSVLRSSAWAALVLCAPLSWLSAGLVGGTVHIVAVLMGWLYDFRLARTMWSWVPYAIAFGLLPIVAATGIDVPVTWWLVAVFAIVGVSAHLANALRDADVDQTAGVANIAEHLGARRTRVIALCLLLVGVVIAGAAMRDAIAIAALALVWLVIALASHRHDERLFALLLGGAGALSAIVLVRGF